MPQFQTNIRSVCTVVDSDANATIVSIDGSGAFDLVSRNAMLRGLKEMDR